jgi:6-phosphofructokinase 1
MEAKVRVAITTGGGDCPGLNCVIRALVLKGLHEYGWEMFGILDGLDGLISGDGVIPLGVADVRDIHNLGGTILGTTNRGNPFRYPVTENGETTEVDLSDRMIARANELGIDAVVFVGGDGTQEIASRLAAKGLHVVGVPKTIDNDLLATDYTFGFDTAVETVVQALDRLRTTGRSHDRTMILEVMGRHAGWIALHAGLAGGADVILLPEIPYDIAAVAAHLRRRQESGVAYNIIVISEGASPVGGAPSYQEEAGKGTVARLGGAGEHFAEALAAEGSFESRVTVLGHIQRGGTPSSTDRVLATRFGAAAAGLVARGEFSRMVCLRGNAIESVSIDEVAGRQKHVSVDSEIVNAARALGICLGDRLSK